MRFHEILYDWPIVELNRLADSVETEDFAANLAGNPYEDDFVRITERLRNLSAVLAGAKAARTKIVEWPEILALLNEFEGKFNEFPNSNFRQVRLFCVFAQRLTEFETDLAGGDVDPNQFQLLPIDNRIPIEWFKYQNSERFEDSIAVFCLDDLLLPDEDTENEGSDSETSGLELELTNANFSPEFLFQILAVLSTSGPIEQEAQVVFVKVQEPPIDAEAASAFARLLILSCGKQIHLLEEYTTPPSVLNSNLFVAGLDYHQFDTTFNVLSEYNSRSDLLSKYLSLYHVFENLMFKRPIVQLETESGGRMFSIRDFKRLYKQVSKKEIDVLKPLFQEVFQLPVDGETFRKHIEDKWDSICDGNEALINEMLVKLGITKSSGVQLTHNEFDKNNNSYNYFARIVYATRNVIVHNTETEWHLTYANMDVGAKVLLADFLIPTLEEICFEVLGQNVAQLWYSNREIALY